MGSDKLKHLDYIQATIARMATHSFALKGWAVTLSTALFAAILALTSRAPARADFRIVYLPIASFWLLDAYYLSRERLYRRLYDHIRQKPDDETDFTMDTRAAGRVRFVWLRSVVSIPTLLFYVSLILAISIIAYYVR